MKRESMNKAIEERFFASLGITVGTGATFVLLTIAACVVPSARAQVTPQRLQDSAKEPQNWLMYSGDYAGRRFSTLEQINTSNAAMLVPSGFIRRWRAGNSKRLRWLWMEFFMARAG